MSAIKTPSRPADDQGVAVIGMSCRLPGDLRTPQEFWEALINGQDCITPVPAERWPIDDYYDADPAKPGTINTRSGGFLNEVDLFDANFFGISPREAMSMDPQQRLTLEACWEAIESAGIPAARIRGSRTGVYMGVTMTDYYDLQKKHNDASLIDGYTGTGGFLNSVSGRVSYFFRIARSQYGGGRGLRFLAGLCASRGPQRSQRGVRSCPGRRSESDSRAGRLCLSFPRPARWRPMGAAKPSMRTPTAWVAPRAWACFCSKDSRTPGATGIGYWA